MTDTPPALADLEQYTAEYWKKVPRRTAKAKIARITNRDNGFVEIALTNNVAFMRQKSDIKQLLTPNLNVNIEVLGPNGEIITGLFVPDVGWAFRMTNEDLAEYAKGLAVAEHRRRGRVRDSMVDHAELALEMDLARQMGECPDQPDRYADWIDVRALAEATIKALEAGPRL